MSRLFIDLDMPDGLSGNYEVVTDYKGLPGKNLFIKSVHPIKGDVYTGVMHEKFKEDLQYKTILQRIDGDVLYIGMGLGLLAKAMASIATLQDCVELEQDISNLCGGVFDNVFISDRNEYTPVKKYDTIVLDCFNGYDASKEGYLNLIDSLESKYESHLNNGGKVLKYIIGK